MLCVLWNPRTRCATVWLQSPLMLKPLSSIGPSTTTALTVMGWGYRRFLSIRELCIWRRGGVPPHKLRCWKLDAKLIPIEGGGMAEALGSSASLEEVGYFLTLFSNFHGVNSELTFSSSLCYSALSQDQSQRYGWLCTESSETMKTSKLWFKHQQNNF